MTSSPLSQFESYNHTELCPDWTNYLWYLFIKIRFDFFLSNDDIIFLAELGFPV